MSESQHTESQQTDHEADLEETLERATEAVTVQASEIADLAEGEATAGGEPLGLDNLLGVPVRVTVQVGRTSLPLSQLVALGPGSVLALDRESHEPVDILVQGKVVAKGEIVTIDDMYGVRITQVLAEERAAAGA